MQCGHHTFHGRRIASIFQLYIGTLFLHAGQWPFDHTIHDRLMVLPNISDHRWSSDILRHGSAALTMFFWIAAAHGRFFAFARARCTSCFG